MQRLLALLFVLLLASLWPVTGFPAAESHSLVRCWLDGRTADDLPKSDPGLDIVKVKPGSYVEIVTRARDLDRLRGMGLRVDLIHADLEAHYRSRLAPEKSDSFGIYHNYPEAVAFMDSLRMLYPEVVSQRWSLGQGHEGRDLWCFRMSDNPDVDEDEPEVLFDGVHHAREVMASEFCLMFAQYLAQGYESGDGEIVSLLQGREIYFVPVVNPDGFVYNDWGDMWRKNRRNNGDGTYGVDLNRNYPYEWGGAGSSGFTYDVTYRGPSAGSEPETQAMMSLINAHQFVTGNSVHTYGDLTLFPWGYTISHTPDHSTFVLMGEEMTRVNGYTYGQPPAVLYEVSGGAIDWSYGAQTEHPKIFAFSSELGGDSDGFWPPESRRQALFDENLDAALYLVRAAAAYVVASAPAVLGGDGNGRLDPGESAGVSFTITNQGVLTAANGVTITVACDDPYVQLGEADRSLGNMAAVSSTDLSADPLPLVVDAACPVGRIIELAVTCAHSAGSVTRALAFPVGEPTMLLSEDFEDGTSRWSLESPWGLTTSSSHSASHSLTDSPTGYYANERNLSATTTATYPASALSFWHHYDIEQGWDYAYVEVSADGGPWQPLASYTGLSSSWQQVQIPLASYAGQDLRLRFRLETDYSITEDGWYVDDIELTGWNNENQPPPAPTLLSPLAGANVGAQPELTVANSYDPDGSDTLTYGFRIYADPLQTDLVASGDGIAEGVGQTSWTAPSLTTGTYYWRAYAADATAAGLMGETGMFTVDELSGVGPFAGRLSLMRLGPAGSPVRLQLDLPRDSRVQLAIYDLSGRLVRRLENGTLPAGRSILSWDGRDRAGRSSASGVYFARLQAGREVLTSRFLVVR
jgi:carboxypeptidase T